MSTSQEIWLRVLQLNRFISIFGNMLYEIMSSVKDGIIFNCECIVYDLIMRRAVNRRNYKMYGYCKMSVAIERVRDV